MKFETGLKFEDAVIQERIGAFLESDIHLLSGEEERNSTPHSQWLFRCTICRCIILGLHGAQNHMDGNRHKQNIIFTKTGEGEFMESKYKNCQGKTSAPNDSTFIEPEMMELWDEETNQEINPETRKDSYDPSNPTSTSTTSCVPIPNKTQVPKAAHPYLTMQEKLTSLVEPIVGLESVVEHHIETGEMPPYYECQLCSSDMADANLINHLKGRSHRMNYFKSKNPEKHASVSNLASYNVGRAMLKAIVELEEKFGRGFMPIVIDKDVTKHPDSKNYQTLREKKKDDKNAQKRPLTMENQNITNNKERKKKRGMLGKPTSITKGPVTNPAFGRNPVNNSFPMHNYNNFTPNPQDPMGYYQTYYGQMQMGTNNLNQARQIPPINPELCPPTSSQSILGQAPDNAPLLGVAPITNNQSILGPAPTTGNQSILGAAPINGANTIGQGLMNSPNFGTMSPMINSNTIMGAGTTMMNNNNYMMGQGPSLMNRNMMSSEGPGNAVVNQNMMGQSNAMMNTIMMGQGNAMMNTNMLGQGNIMMNQNMMVQGNGMMNHNMMAQNNAMMNSNMMAQGNTMMNSNMMAQGNTMMNSNMMAQGNTMMNSNMMAQGNTMMNSNMMAQGNTMTNSNMINQGHLATNLNTLMNQTQGFNGNQVNSMNSNAITPGLVTNPSQMNQSVIANSALGSQGLINSNSSQNMGQTLIATTTTSNQINGHGVFNQTLSSVQTNSGANSTSSVQGLLETPKPKDSLLGPPPATLFGEIKGKSQYNFISSKPQSIPLLGSDGQLTEKEAEKKLEDIKERGVLLDALATWEIKTEEEASAALKVINSLTQSLNQYKEKNKTTKITNLPKTKDSNEKKVKAEANNINSESVCLEPDIKKAEK